jgi:hypothetical protein
VNLTIAIAHHPSRDHLLGPLLDKLGERAEVVVDDKPERMHAWMNAKRAWNLGRELGGTHHLVMENDVTVCRDFLAAVREGIERWPNEMVRWYAPDNNPAEGRPFRKAIAADERWCDCVHWGGAQAVAMPVAWIESFVHWGESYPEHGTAPDSRLREWLRKRVRRPVKTSVPCLAEHGLAPSLNDPTHRFDHRAISYIGDDRSALEYAWT